MVAKLQSLSYLKNILDYCERGGQLLASHKCIGNSSEINSQMERNNSMNDRCQNHTFHIKIRIAPEDKGKLNTQDWIDISNDYANKFKFQNNPFAVYIHEEKDSSKTHIHIVASRIQPNNLAVKDHYTHYRNMDFCRTIETKYGLRKVKRKLEKLKKQEVFLSSNKRLVSLKQKIETSIQNSDNMNQFIGNLKEQKISVKVGRGIVFTDDKGVKFKGSQIKRDFSLKAIEKQLQNKEIRDIEKQLKNREVGKTESYGRSL